MNVLYLIMAMTFSAMITVDSRLYNQRNRERSHVTCFYNLLASCSASLGWLALFVFDFSFDVGILPYSLIYGFGYTAFTVGMLGALKHGSTSLTGLAIGAVALVFLNL